MSMPSKKAVIDKITPAMGFNSRPAVGGWSLSRELEIGFKNSSDGAGTHTVVANLRPLQLKDISHCNALGQQLFSFSPCLSRTFDTFVVVECYSNEPELCFVIEIEGKVIGFILASIITKAAGTRRFGYLNWVAVDKQYQRKGLGTLLASTVIRIMETKDVELILVDTPQENYAALEFLKKFGFDNPIEQVYLTLHYVPVSTPDKPDEEQTIEKVKEDLAERKNDIEKAASKKRTAEIAESELPLKKFKEDEDLVKIRQMTLEDVYPVYVIGEEAFTEVRPNLYRFWDEWQVLDNFNADTELTMVAEMDNKVVGFCLGSTLERKETKFGYLIWLAVRSNVQGHRIGHKLYYAYQKKLAELYGIHDIIIDTQANNLRAIEFFESLGFTLTEKFYYLSKGMVSEEQQESEKKDGD